ncbi:hypothetical protein Tco_0342909, partial [Tanacetum coccineum]
VVVRRSKFPLKLSVVIFSSDKDRSLETRASSNCLIFSSWALFLSRRLSISLSQLQQASLPRRLLYRHNSSRPAEGPCDRPTKQYGYRGPPPDDSESRLVFQKVLDMRSRLGIARHNHHLTPHTVAKCQFRPKPLDW